MRRLRKILFFIILSAWTLTSCEKDTGTETVNVPIGFSNNVTTATRASDINNDNLTSIGVFASLTHGNFDATVSTPNFMYNQLVEKKNGTWQYTPLYNPQNEMFRLLGTKRSFSQNETFFFSHPYPPTLPFSA